MPFNVWFISASVPIAKTITETGVSPYPKVFEVTSHREEVTGITDFHEKIVRHAKRGHALMKGELTRELFEESRAGTTDPDAPTRWIELDIDSTEGETSEDIVKLLPAEFHNVSYVWQYSATSAPGKVKGHFFFVLDNAMQPRILKKILTKLNFRKGFRCQLSKNGLGLKYAIDPSVATNDKMLYIAPPVLKHGAEDHYKNRTALVVKAVGELRLKVDIENTDSLVSAEIARLRKESGLERRTPKYDMSGTVEYLKNPEKGLFRPTLEARGFVYGNLNDGDSEAYYHAVDDPVFLHNFKGEPPVKLKDIDPVYWARYNRVKTSGKEYIAFRDKVSDTYYTLTIDGDDVDIRTVGNLKKAIDFMTFYNQPVPEALPIWQVVFAPDENFSVDKKGMRLNTYRSSGVVPVRTDQLPSEFGRLVWHVCGNCQQTMADFLNWLAFVVQKKRKTKTAYVLHGTSGTGKGVLFSRVLQPILGVEYCPIVTMSEIDSQFNGWMDKAILVAVDEAQVADDSKRAGARMNAIKNMITEDSVLIKKKYQNAYAERSFSSFIFMSNCHDSVQIDESDRRFKVAPRQEEKIALEIEDIARLDAELPLIAGYLMQRKVDETAVYNTKTGNAAARSALIESSKNSVDEFADIVKRGELDRVLMYRGEFVNTKSAIFVTRLDQLLVEWETAASKGETVMVPTGDLRVLYGFLFGIEINPTKFGRLLAYKGIEVRVRWSDNRAARSVAVKWRTNSLRPETAASERVDFRTLN